MSVLDILIQYRYALLDGLFVTLQLFFFSSLIGLSLGSIFGILAFQHKHIALFVKASAFLLQSIPILVFLFWMHYPLQSLLRLVIDPFFTALFVLSILNISAIANLFQESLKAFPSQYTLVAKVHGLSAKTTFFHIQLPLLFRQIAPNLFHIQLQILQATLFASLISVEEIFRVAQRINAEIYKPVEIYTTLALLFIMILLPLNYTIAQLKERYTRDVSER